MARRPRKLSFPKLVARGRAADARGRAAVRSYGHAVSFCNLVGGNRRGSDVGHACVGGCQGHRSR
eukprot:9559244-Lingulodinium_polyedra.AAC.1